MTTTKPLLTEENVDDIMYSARAGELSELKTLIKDLTAAEVMELKDTQNNTPLHMASANGFVGRFLFFAFIFACQRMLEPVL